MTRLESKRILKSVFKTVAGALAVLLAIGAAVYSVAQMIHNSGTDMTVATVNGARVTDTVGLSGVIFRNETVLYSSKYGQVNRLCANGERAAKNSQVAEIRESGAASESELEFIDRQIALLTESNKVSDTSTKTTDAEISRLFFSLRQRAEDGDYLNISSKLEELLILLNRREIIVNARVNFNAEIAAWQIKRDGIVKSAGDTLEVVSTPYAGYFYREVDGYENTLTADALENVSFSELSALLSAGPEQLTVTDSGYAIGKIATSSIWYLCAKTDVMTASGLTEGETYKITFPYSSDKEIGFLLESVCASGDEAILIFRTDELPKDLSFTRKQTVLLTAKEIKGLYVPESAVKVNGEGKTGVFILKDNLTTFRRIDIIKAEEGYYIVKELLPDDEGYENSLHLHDVIVTGGAGIKEQIDLPEEESTEYRIIIFE